MQESVKEIPMLYTTPMVQSVDAGLKQQTRRLRGLDEVNQSPDDWTLTHQDKKGIFHFRNGQSGWAVTSPYGKPGDIIWVRETFTHLHWDHYENGESPYAYKANCDAESEEIRQEYIKAGYQYQWKPSLHMPRKAARLFLKITTIRLERLQDISDDDCIKEGLEQYTDHHGTGYRLYTKIGGFSFIPRDSFQTLWDSINGKAKKDRPLCNWDANPWVWVVEFEKIEHK